MKKFKVTWNETLYYSKIVEAEDIGDAFMIAVETAEEKDIMESDTNEEYCEEIQEEDTTENSAAETTS